MTSTETGDAKIIQFPTLAEETTSTDDVTFLDLAFIAERLLRRTLEQIDWEALGLEEAALLLVDESDAKTVLRLIKKAVIDVDILPGHGYEEGA